MPDKTTTRAYWAEKIRTQYAASVENIIKTGCLLIEAKAKLAHGEWEKMIGHDLPFSERTAERFMAIGRDQRLSKATISSLLPPSWTTLYDLTRLEDEQFDKAASDGTINPNMTGAEVQVILNPPSNVVPMRAEPSEEPRKRYVTIMRLRHEHSEPHKIVPIYVSEPEPSPEPEAKEEGKPQVNHWDFHNALGGATSLVNKVEDDEYEIRTDLVPQLRVTAGSLMALAQRLIKIAERLEARVEEEPPT